LASFWDKSKTFKPHAEVSLEDLVPENKFHTHPTRRRYCEKYRMGVPIWVVTVETTTNASRFGLAFYGLGLGLALVANIAGHIMRDRVFLWMGIVGVVAIAVGWVMDVVAQRRGRID
jgi:hypothetical protein